MMNIYIVCVNDFIIELRPAPALGLAVVSPPCWEEERGGDGGGS